MSRSDNWEFIFLLHNLDLKEAFESDFMAIVPNNDARMSKISADVPAVASLVHNFTDQRGNHRPPCALIIRKDPPSRIRSFEAILSFRNIFALSCLLYAWPRTIGRPNVFFPLWSDFFDFYPISLSRDPHFLHNFLPATDGACPPQNFSGQVAPNLPNPSHLRFQPEDKIRSLLMSAWEKEFAGTDSLEWKTRVLFRSLDMAYQATSVPSNSRPSIYEFWSRIALWVSAFEVLVHPGGEKGRADIGKVTNLLRQASWRNRRLKQLEHQPNIRRKPTDVNLVQKLYEQLYEARNNFLHGNPVTHGCLFCFRNEQRPSLIEIAPLIYKVALNCHLGHSHNSKKAEDGAPNYRELFDRRALENAFLTTLENRKDHEC
jgi:hypothetical protein